MVESCLSWVGKWRARACVCVCVCVCVCWGWGWVEGAQDRESFRLARDRPGRFLQHPLPSPVPSPTPCSWEAVAYGWGKWKERKP